MKESMEESLKRKHPNISPPSSEINISNLIISTKKSNSKRSKMENQFDFLLEDPDCYIVDLENFVEINSPVVENSTSTSEMEINPIVSRDIQDNQRYYFFFFKDFLLIIIFKVLGGLCPTLFSSHQLLSVAVIVPVQFLHLLRSLINIVNTIFLLNLF